MKKSPLIIVVAMLLAACAKDKGAPAPVEEKTPPPVTRQQPPPRETGPETNVTKPAQITVDPLNDPKNILSKRSVYFDYDSYSVKDEFKPLVSAHAKFLTDNRGRKIVIQGNTDERGSSEYNLALGQRRADAVKKMMQLLGVSDGQIETVSFGKEKPKSQGKDESAYAENRRDDIVYEAK